MGEQMADHPNPPRRVEIEQQVHARVYPWNRGRQPVVHLERPKNIEAPSPAAHNLVGHELPARKESDRSKPAFARPLGEPVQERSRRGAGRAKLYGGPHRSPARAALRPVNNRAVMPAIANPRRRSRRRKPSAHRWVVRESGRSRRRPGWFASALGRWLALPRARATPTPQTPDARRPENADRAPTAQPPHRAPRCVVATGARARERRTACAVGLRLGSRRRGPRGLGFARDSRRTLVHGRRIGAWGLVGSGDTVRSYEHELAEAIDRRRAAVAKKRAADDFGSAQWPSVTDASGDGAAPTGGANDPVLVPGPRRKRLAKVDFAKKWHPRPGVYVIQSARRYGDVSDGAGPWSAPA